MDRRRFLLISLAGVVAAPLVVDAQTARATYRIGVLELVPGAAFPAYSLWASAGYGVAPTPWRAVQQAAWAALRTGSIA